MQCRPGFDRQAAEAMQNAQGEAAPLFLERCEKALFWGLYDPEPVGGIVIEHHCIHVSSFRPCGFAVRRIVADYLKTHPVLLAPIRPDNRRALRLAKGLGFLFFKEMNGFYIFRRDAS